MKKLLIIITSLFILSSLSAQDAAQEEVVQKKQHSPADFVMQFEPGGYINTTPLNSVPANIIYPISIGFLWPNRSKIAIQPTVSFFMMNHLYYDGEALPAEIENRTTTTLSFLLNIPAVFSFYYPQSNFQITAGIGIFMRFGIRSPGVDENDSGWTGTAGSDVKAINKWFWGNMRWLYLTLGGCWLYNLTPQLRAGPTLNICVPAGGLISDHTLQASIISAGIKICR